MRRFASEKKSRSSGCSCLEPAADKLRLRPLPAVARLPLLREIDWVAFPSVRPDRRFPDADSQTLISQALISQTLIDSQPGCKRESLTKDFHGVFT